MALCAAKPNYHTMHMRFDTCFAVPTESTVRKINVNTECKQSYCRALATELAWRKEKSDPAALERAGVAAIAETIQAKMALFGCLGKA